MKRRLYAFAALLLAMNFVVSCGNTSENSDTSSDTADSTPDTETSDRIAELGEKNFDGATFTILDTHGDINVNIPDESLEGDVVNDSVARRNMQIEETYNIVFAYPESNSNEKCQTLRNSVLASLDEYDMLFWRISAKWSSCRWIKIGGVRWSTKTVGSMGLCITPPETFRRSPIVRLAACMPTQI